MLGKYTVETLIKHSSFGEILVTLTIVLALSWPVQRVLDKCCTFHFPLRLEHFSKYIVIRDKSYSDTEDD